MPTSMLKKNSSKNLGKNKTRCRDIREMFAQKSQETRDESSSSTTCINID